MMDETSVQQSWGGQAVNMNANATATAIVTATTTANVAVLDQQTKMFVGGLAQTVNSEFLRTYFSHFGDIEDAFVLMDDHSGRSRGFGFVTFKHSHSITHVLNQAPHFLGNKQVDCKPAVTKTVPAKRPPAPATSAVECIGGPVQVPASTDFMNLHKHLAQIPSLVPRPEDEEMADWSDQDGNTDVILTGGGKSYLALSGDKWLEDCEEADARKIFVGGLPDISPAEFASFFEHFGPVSDAMVMFDRKRRRQRGFGFITFGTNEGVRNSLQFNRHPVKGKLVEVKMAHPLVLQKARAPARRERDLAKANKAEAVAKSGPQAVCGNYGIIPGHPAVVVPGMVDESTECIGSYPMSMSMVMTMASPVNLPTEVSHDFMAGYGYRPSETIIQCPPTFPDAPWHR